MKFYRSWASGCQNKEDNMATFSGTAFYGDRRRRYRPRVSDDTAEKILQRIAQGNSSDLDLSDSDDDTIVDPSFSAPLQGVTSDEDESGDDGPSTSTSKSAKVSWKRLQGPVPTWIPDFISDAVDSSAARVSWTPSDYCQYVPEEAYEKMADAMNRSHVHESGRSLNVTAKHVCIDEQMIPFTGRTQFKQFVPRKQNPEGLKNLVLAAPNGLILDFEIYQGNKARISPEASGIAEAAVLRLAESLKPGTKLYFDHYFVSGALLDKLQQKGIAATGPVMNNLLPKGVKLSSEKELKAKGRNVSEAWIRHGKSQVVLRWYDNKVITMLSSIHGQEPEDTCRRWSRKEKYIDVPRPYIIVMYNLKMGGVDLADRMISYYRIKARINKWNLNLATFNARTLSSEGSLAVLFEELEGVCYGVMWAQDPE
ncbi:hypothetical protein HPB51_005306 [Rhipicephalus microplus]|uniref:PiggyBac transposable element-derived protein domain-containing protein n=1 Tax=Rhipicephalus microplus TaxID=6941 RepID=A0A9J6EXL6_RHIMP|nr:hypothetical protein HPB51_005306 [Rhipicephalus microplus]